MGAGMIRGCGTAASSGNWSILSRLDPSSRYLLAADGCLHLWSKKSLGFDDWTVWYERLDARGELIIRAGYEPGQLLDVAKDFIHLMIVLIRHTAVRRWSNPAVSRDPPWHRPYSVVQTIAILWPHQQNSGKVSRSRGDSADFGGNVRLWYFQTKTSVYGRLIHMYGVMTRILGMRLWMLIGTGPQWFMTLRFS